MNPTEVPVRLGRATSFADQAEGNPCEGCSAPCCRLTIVPQPEPRTFRALDTLRFLAAHEDHELLLDRQGRWHLAVERPCRLLTDDRRCSVHGTSAQPKICVYFSPHNCWYKRNFHEVTDPPDLIRMDLAAFGRVVGQVAFDAEGNVTGVPPYEELRRLASGRGEPFSTVSG